MGAARYSDKTSVRSISDGRFKSADMELILSPHFFKFETADIIGLVNQEG